MVFTCAWGSVLYFSWERFKSVFDKCKILYTFWLIWLILFNIWVIPELLPRPSNAVMLWLLELHFLLKNIYLWFNDGGQKDGHMSWDCGATRSSLSAGMPSSRPSSNGCPAVLGAPVSSRAISSLSEAPASAAATTCLPAACWEQLSPRKVVERWNAQSLSLSLASVLLLCREWILCSEACTPPDRSRVSVTPWGRSCQGQEVSSWLKNGQENGIGRAGKVRWGRQFLIWKGISAKEAVIESRGGRLLNMGGIASERSVSFRTCRSHKMTITQPANSAPQVSKHNLKTLKISQPPVDLNYENATVVA